MLPENTKPPAKMLTDKSAHRQRVKLRHRLKQLKLENEMTEHQIKLLREEITYLKKIVLKHQKYHETQI